MKKTFLFLAVLCSIALLSCSKKDSNNETFTVGHGVFVLNEGNYTNSNASLSFYDFTKDTVENDLFYRVNDAPLGDVAQSLTSYNHSLYVVVNNSKDIYKLDEKTIEYKAKLGGFYSPRYMLPVGNGKAYVSDLAASGLWVVDLGNFSHSKFIETGKAVECMVKVGDEVFAANWSKQYVTAENNTIQVVNCVNDEKVAEIVVAHEPNDMAVDKYNHIWVSCSGGYMPPCDPAIICVDPVTRQVIRRFDLPEGCYPSRIVTDKDGENVYYMNGGYSTLKVYKMPADATELPATPFIADAARSFYNLIVNPENGDIYVTDVKDYIQSGELLRYSSEGALLGTYHVGIIPSYMLFN